MQTYAIPILPAQWADEAARTAASMSAALNDEEILAFEQCPNPGPHNGADIQAVRNKDGVVFARLIEYRLEAPGRLLMGIQDEKDGIPEHRLAPLSVFSLLTPTEDRVSLKWRDLSRHALALSGHFRPQSMTNTATDSGKPETDGKSGNSGEARERIRSREEKLPQGREAPAANSQSEAAAPSVSREHRKRVRLRLLVDRPPQILTASSSGAKFIKFGAYAIEGAVGFMKVVIFRSAESVAQRIADAIKETGTAVIDMEGPEILSTKKPREFKVDTVNSIASSHRTIPERDNQRPGKNGPSGRQSRSQASEDPQI